jgi:aspartyl-tRNA(Asn)/glutamyl-tRNA(Gln) amidotransferase subunit C
MLSYKGLEAGEDAVDSKISKEDVEHIARLARLEVTEDEKGAFARQLSAIVSYMDQLRSLDTSAVKPTATVLPAVNVFRDDEVEESLLPEKALGNAPDQADGFFRVPRIIEDR